MIGMLKRYIAVQRSSKAIARLYSGAMSERDTTHLKTWPDDAPEYRQCFLNTVHLLADMEPLTDDPELRAAVANPAVTESRNDNLTRSWWPAFAVGVIAVLAIIIGMQQRGQPVEQDNTILRYVTRVGEQKSVELVDGSLVYLNTGTQLLVDISESERRIILERGEAYFDVAKDLQRPFTVALGERNVTALGTEFNILKSPEKFTLTVVEGVVSLHQHQDTASESAPFLNAPTGKTVRQDGAEKRRVGAGMVVEFNVQRRELVAYKAEKLTKLYSWRDGVLHFEAEPLYKVILELNRYSGKKILIKDPSIMELEVYAAIRLDRLDIVPAVLERALPIKVIQHFDRMEIEGSCKLQSEGCK